MSQTVVTVQSAAEREPSDAPEGGRGSRGAGLAGPPGWASGLHVVSLAAALAVLLWEDRHLWFFGDDWEFIVGRGLHHPLRSIWQPHNEHWSTLPILLYRLLYTVFGLHFAPYIVAALLVHVVLAHLIWRTCLREGVDPWVATAFVAVFLLLGAGAENLTWAFQIGFMGSLAFGYLALEVSRHRISIATDTLVAAALIGSLMCSTIGDVMVVAAAVSMVLLRGWRRSVLPLVPPIVAYAAWYGLVGRRAVAADHIAGSTFSHVPNFAWTGISTALGSIVSMAHTGKILVVILAAFVLYRWRGLWRDHPTVLGLALAVPLFYCLAGSGRDASLAASQASRYVYIATALLIPLVATLVTSFAPDGPRMRVPVIVVLVVVFAANVGALRDFASTRTTLVQGERAQVVTTATLLSQGTPSLVPNPIVYSPDITTADLLRFVHLGQLHPVPVTTQERLVDEAAMDVLASTRAVVSGSLALSGSADVQIRTTVPGCVSVTATGATPQVVLEAPSGSGSVEVIAGAPGQALLPYLQSDGITAAAPAVALGQGQMVVLNVDVANAVVIATVPAVGSTQLCGLVTPPAQLGPG